MSCYVYSRMCRLADVLTHFGRKDWLMASIVCKTLWNYRWARHVTDTPFMKSHDGSLLYRTLSVPVSLSLVLSFSVSFSLCVFLHASFSVGLFLSPSISYSLSLRGFLRFSLCSLSPLCLLFSYYVSLPLSPGLSLCVSPSMLLSFS